MLALLAVMATAIGASQDSVTLRDAERAFGMQVARDGLAAGVATAAADVVLLHAGAPVVVGRDRAHALLAAQPLLDSLRLELRPTDLWVSTGGGFGVSQGYLDISPPAATPTRGTYIAGWRREADRWRLSALMVAGLAPADRTIRGDDPAELPALPASGPAAAMIRADLEFSALAGREGAPAAFTAYAAPDAVMLGPDGPRRGPEAVGASIGRGPPADWSWYPVVARIAAAGDLGFTVGQAVIRPRSGDAPALSKYLTVWRREPDGTMRFLTDGGNARPRP